MNKQEFIDAMNKYNFGNFVASKEHFKRIVVREDGEHLQRIKVQSNSVRIEVQAIIPADQYSPMRKMWVRLESAYFKDIIQRTRKRKDTGIEVQTIKIGHYEFVEQL